MCSRKKAAVVEEILHWLDMNYELSEGVCIPRCLLYQHYLDSCRLKSCPPIGAAAFGKMVRRKFNQISTRRLGTRGQSKYHYYGLAIRPDSRYYGSSFESEVEENRSLPSFSVFKSKITTSPVPEVEEVEKQCEPIEGRSSQRIQESGSRVKSRQKSSENAMNEKSLESRIEAAVFIMKSFPRSYDLSHIPSNIDSYELDTFLLMYKTHCDRLLDSFLCDQLDDVHLYIKHFWSQIPEHFNQLLSSNSSSSNFSPSNDFIASIIETCDYLFYEALETGLIPEDLNTVSEHLVTILTFLSVNFDSWIRECISNSLPSNLVQVKMKDSFTFDFIKIFVRKFEIMSITNNQIVYTLPVPTVLDDFVKSIRRHLSLIPLVKSCNLIVNQRMILDKMENDLKKIELFNIIEEDIGLFDARAVTHVRNLIQFIVHSFGGSDAITGTNEVMLNNLIRLIKGTIQEFVRNTRFHSLLLSDFLLPQSFAPSLLFVCVTHLLDSRILSKQIKFQDNEIPVMMMMSNTSPCPSLNHTSFNPQSSSSSFSSSASSSFPSSASSSFTSSASSSLTHLLSSSSQCLISRGVVILLTIGRAVSSLSRELTLSNSSSFGYWHLIFLLINDYSLITFESLIRKQNQTARRTALLNTHSVHNVSSIISSIPSESVVPLYPYAQVSQARESVESYNNFQSQNQSVTQNDFSDEIKEFIQL